MCEGEGAARRDVMPLRGAERELMALNGVQSANLEQLSSSSTSKEW